MYMYVVAEELQNQQFGPHIFVLLGRLNRVSAQNLTTDR